MTAKRKAELFDTAIAWIFEHTYSYGIDAYYRALKNVGYTDEEIQKEKEISEIEEEK